MGNWFRTRDKRGQWEYHWGQDEADAVLWQNNGPWMLSYSMDWHEPWRRTDLPNARTAEEALQQAETVLWAKFEEYHELEQAITRFVNNKGDSMKALLIPADPTRRVETVEINGTDDLRKHLGGIPEPTRYDSDALMFVDDSGRINGKAMNARATDYIKQESEAASQDLAGQGDPSYGLFGDVVVVGDGGFAGLRDVPDRLVTRFAPQPEVTRSDTANGVKHERNEDGMLRLPGLSTVSPNWLRAVNEDTNEVRYQYWDGKAEGIVWKEDGRWKMHFTPGDHSEALHVDLGKTRSINKALSRADDVIGMANALPAAESKTITVTNEDLTNVVNLASEIADRTPEEQASLGRLTQQLDGPSLESAELRAEVKEAYAAWQADLSNDELEQDYFDKLTDLDRNLTERGLERGENIDEELPLGTSLGEGRNLDRPSFDRSEGNGYEL
jgi:hypothetical protein